MPHHPCADELQLLEPVGTIDPVIIRAVRGLAELGERGGHATANFGRHMAFLRDLAQLLLRTHGADLLNVAVVLPSRRAGLHLQRHLAEAHDRPLWSPVLLTPDGFLERISGLQEQPTHLTLLELHAVHRSIKGPAADDLHTFLGWAPTALLDMNEVDEHLLDPAVVYRELHQFEEIDAWSFTGGQLSEGQQRLAHHWAHHAALHQGLLERLVQRGVATRGAIARTAAARMASPVYTPPWHRVWVAGLNITSPAMHRVVDLLRERGMVHLAWDADRHYMDDPLQEAGRALRVSVERHGPGELPLSERIATAPPTVRTIALPNAISMVMAAIEEVMALPAEERAQTCVLLADQQLLLPFLSLLPAACGPVNVTMGLPLAHLPLNSLFALHVRLHASADERGMRTADLLALLEHPAWSDSKTVTRMRSSLYGERRTHVPLHELHGDVEDPVYVALVAALSTAPGQGTAAWDALVEAITSTGPDPFVREQAHRIATVLHQVTVALAATGEAPGDQAVAMLLERLMRQARVELRGEPMNGLQVMGMMESRATDHERVIIVGANEGQLPPADTVQSFIPGDLRRHLGLPLRGEMDAIAAHTFMRLLHHSGSLTLMHTSEGETGNERSRFVLQLEREVPGILEPGSRRPAMAKREGKPILLPLTDELLILLKERAFHGFSPSALNDLLNCPLNFLFRHAWRTRDEESTAGMMADNELGNLVHSALEHHYGPYVGGMIDPVRLMDELPGTLERLPEWLPKGMSGNEGAVLLQLHMAKQAIKRMVRSEAQLIQGGQGIRLVGLETPLKALLPAASHGLSHDVYLRGRLDRIERRDGIVHLVDIKTGGVDPNKLKIELPTSLRPDDNKILQLLVYAWLWLTTHPDEKAVVTRIVSMRNADPAKPICLKLNEDDLITRERLPLIEAALVEVIQRLFDPAMVFAHNPESKYCTICRE